MRLYEWGLRHKLLSMGILGDIAGLGIMLSSLFISPEMSENVRKYYDLAQKIDGALLAKVGPETFFRGQGDYNLDSLRTAVKDLQHFPGFVSDKARYDKEALAFDGKRKERALLGLEIFAGFSLLTALGFGVEG